MKRFFFAIFLLPLVLGSCGSSDQTDQETDQTDTLQSVTTDINETFIVNEDSGTDLFTHEDGHFQIRFPGTPTESSDIVPTDVGDIEMVTLLYEKSATEVYMVAYSDYPSSMVSASSPEGLLNSAKEGALNNLEILVTENEQNISINDFPGISFRGNNGTYYVQYEMFLVGNRLYQVGILRDGSYVPEDKANAFFSSFKLTNVPD